MERPSFGSWMQWVFLVVGALVVLGGYLGGGLTGLSWASLVIVGLAALYVVLFRVVMPGSHRPSTVAGAARPQEKEPPELDVSTLLASGNRNVCPPGPHDVEKGRPKKIHLNVQGIPPGWRVVGTLEEADGLDFDYMIINEDHWVKFQQEKEFAVQDGYLGEHTYKVKWRIPRKGGPWFLVLLTWSKRITRHVEVNLRVEPPR